MKIKYIDAPAGSGKTRFLISEIGEMVQWDRNILLCQPSKALVDQTYGDMIERCGADFPVTKIHEDTLSGQNVASAIVGHFKNAGQGGQVVIITHSAFDLVPHFHKARFWDLFFDECPKVEQGFQIDVPQNHAYLTEHIIPSGDGFYVPVRAKSVSRLKAIVGSKDAVDGVFRDATKMMLTKGWKPLVQSEKYRGLLDGDSEATKLSICAVRTKSVISQFKSCTIASAMFRETFFYKIFSRIGVEFIAYDEPQYPPLNGDEPAELAYMDHPNGHLIEIHYLDLPRWSKGIMMHYSEIVSRPH
ncbi:hypothetical protein [Xanthobacter sp. YC-JY1]|uniref:hypothetical protein n=1 Tax=Xanthobacter sp. YC-JY1 TaxID=2419844 RepID=UPI001F1C7D7D|nr:hypothetical protein [Xanthobacter sp. YC-JY1]UJX46516.1 hypothetical protein D7006_18600 [Xanthobacter sp. YC-JY1]